MTFSCIILRVLQYWHQSHSHAMNISISSCLVWLHREASFAFRGHFLMLRITVFPLYYQSACTKSCCLARSSCRIQYPQERLMRKEVQGMAQSRSMALAQVLVPQWTFNPSSCISSPRWSCTVPIFLLSLYFWPYTPSEFGYGSRKFMFGGSTGAFHNYQVISECWGRPCVSTADAAGQNCNQCQNQCEQGQQKPVPVRKLSLVQKVLSSIMRYIYFSSRSNAKHNVGIGHNCLFPFSCDVWLRVSEKKLVGFLICRLSSVASRIRNLFSRRRHR